MYRNARPLPLGGFRVGGQSGSLDSGPTPEQRAGKAIYEARIEADRQRSREQAAQKQHVKKFGHNVRRRRSQRAP